MADLREVAIKEMASIISRNKATLIVDSIIEACIDAVTAPEEQVALLGGPREIDLSSTMTIINDPDPTDKEIDEATDQLLASGDDGPDNLNPEDEL